MNEIAFLIWMGGIVTYINEGRSIFMAIIWPYELGVVLAEKALK